MAEDREQNHETGQRQRPAVWPAGLVVLAGALLNAWPWLVGTVTVPWDSKAHFYPQLAFLARSLAEGQSPFWNPHVFAGWPQVADPQSLIFVPAFLLLAAAGPAPGFAAMDATVFAMLGLGALAIVALFRDRSWPMPGAVVAALSFAFGGSAAWRIQHVGQVLSLSMLPVALWLLARALDRRSAGWGLAAGVAAGLMAAGRDQVALLGLYALAAFAGLHLLAGPGRIGRLRGALGPLAAGALGGLLAAGPPVLLTLLLTEESNRLEIGYMDAGRGSLHPAALITAAVPDLYAQADPEVEFWGPPSLAFGALDTFLAQNMVAIYAGVLPVLALLMHGVARGGLADREVRGLAVAALAFLVYALGWYTPLFRPVFEHLPGVGLFRRPADATFLLAAVLAGLGGHALNRWLSDAPPDRAVALAQAALLGLVFVALPVAFALHADRLPEALGPMALAAATAACGLATMALARRAMRRSAALALILIGGFHAADLALNNAPNESTGLPPAVYDVLRPDTADPVIAFLKARLAETADGARRDRVELAGIDFHWPNAGMVHGFDHVLGYNPLRLARYSRATGAEDHVALPEQRRFAPLFPGYGARLADLLGLRWIVTDVPLSAIDPAADLPEVARFGAIRVYENAGALPRVLFVDGERPVDVAALLADGAWPEGFDPAREVLLAQAQPRPPGPTPPGRARIARYANTEVVVEVEAERPGVLVLNDMWHRWWRAEIDGRPVPLLEANGLFRAVRVPAGRHRVRVSFHPFAGALADLAARL